MGDFPKDRWSGDKQLFWTGAKLRDRLELTVDVPDRPGQLARVTGVIGQGGANVIEVYHQRVFTDVPAKGTELNLVIETRDRNHLEAVVASLRTSRIDLNHVEGSGSGPR